MEGDRAVAVAEEGLLGLQAAGLDGRRSRPPGDVALALRIGPQPLEGHQRLGLGDGRIQPWRILRQVGLALLVVGRGPVGIAVPEGDQVVVAFHEDKQGALFGCGAVQPRGQGLAPALEVGALGELPGKHPPHPEARGPQAGGQHALDLRLHILAVEHICDDGDGVQLHEDLHRVDQAVDLPERLGFLLEFLERGHERQRQAVQVEVLKRDGLLLGHGKRLGGSSI